MTIRAANLVGSEMETWLDILGWVGRYQVSDLGRIRSVRTGRVLRAVALADGYWKVNLYRDGKSRGCLVHRAALMAFRGEPKPGEQACHNDGNKANNALTNLRWDSAIANAADKRAHGTHLCGEAIAKSKLTAAQVREIRASSLGIRRLAKRYGVSKETVRRARSGRCWSHV